MSKPGISVLMSVYNDERYVADSIQSILRQSYGDFELIVVNDGSTDGSREIVASFDDPRIRIIDQDNRGLTAALIRAASVARGEIFARQDADDISAPDRFARQVELLGAAPDIAAVGSDRDQITADGQSLGRYGHPVRDAWLRLILAFRNEFGHGSLMIRAGVFRDAGGYDASVRFAQDYDLVWRISRLGRVYNHPSVLYYSRKHDRAITSVSAGEQMNNADAIRSRNTAGWLADPEQAAGDIDRLGAPDTVADALDDDWRDGRRRRFGNLLGQFGVALLIAGRRRECRSMFRVAGSYAGRMSRERLVSALLRVAPGAAENWIRARSRNFDLYNVYFRNKFD